MRAVSTDPTTQLAVEAIQFDHTDQVVILHCPDPALATHWGKTHSVSVYDLEVTTLDKIRAANNSSKGKVSVYEDVFPVSDLRYDSAVITVPKGRDYGRALLYAARGVVKPGGKVYIAGETAGGAKSLIEDAVTIFGSSATLTFKRRSRVGVSIQPESPRGAYPQDWGIDPTQFQQRQIGGVPVWTIPGVFSWEHLDGGTAFLLEHLKLEGNERVLDMGCGYGMIGLSLMGRGAKSAVLVDNNLLAVRCARENAQGLENVTVLAGDIYSTLGDQQFDLIVSNPPFHQKFEVDTNVPHRIIENAFDHLAPGGRLILVCNAFLKYDEVMTPHLARVRELANNGRYRIIEGRRPEKGSVTKAAHRGSKRAALEDEATAFKRHGIIRTVTEKQIADEPGDDELDDLFAELSAAEADRVKSGLNDDWDDENTDWDDEDFDDEDDDHPPPPPAKKPKNPPKGIKK
jgi:16S rRNA (guanine1207-N2)-methyltransferase